MTIENAAFEGYRRSPNERTNLPRLFFGTAIV
ncbi:CPBP family intramembrane metalloprotease, partial [Mesorhizobium sp. M2C.T.Ca.TU.009.01.2.1]